GDPDMVGAIDRSTWAVRGMDATTGAVQWQYRLTGPSYGATTIANGVAFVPSTFDSSLAVLDTATGLPLYNTPVPGPPSSSPVVVGDSVYMGIGTAGLGVGIDSASGILAFQTAI
ncbi:MAG TPA: PQQ-binding-like beta-propeller repeat protein, partial [Nocardioidaceae bacterium]|nr:PQQ-binding-like beta-propeller repeat protein [Nocardioidaceae bacterium]